MPDIARKLLASTRLRHAAIAIIVASLAAILTILRPMDMTVWSIQSKLFDHQASGDIVFVSDLADGRELSTVALNGQLATALDRLAANDAQRVVIDVPLRRSSSPQADQRLRDALTGLDDVVVTRTVREDLNENEQVRDNDPYFERGLPVASSDLETDFLQFVWAADASHSDGMKSFPAIWNEVAENGDRKTAIYLDYSVDIDSIPQIDVAALVRGEASAIAGVSDKTIVIGGLAGDPRAMKAPGLDGGTVSPALLQVVAAETAMRGAGQSWWSASVIACFGLLLLLGLALFQENRARRLFYLAWFAAFPIIFILTAKFGVRTVFSDPALIGLIYAGLRASANFKRRHLFIEPRSKLPNFLALQRDVNDGDDAGSYAIVVAKISRLDALFATIGQADRRRYLRQVASRLTVGDDGTTIYYDGGKYFAFLLRNADYQDLQGHLEGLRAIASQAITLSSGALDVLMTIGVDNSHGNSLPNRISSAIAAADQAREAYRPVFIISDFKADSEAWDYSLQARLEDALSENRISTKLQPKIDVKSGLIVGAEALARWVDEQRGEIPPSQFILQCERVGRLDELTKRVLEKSLSAARQLRDNNLVSQISLNVSAVQFVDTRIADLIERSLVQTGADPKDILIEITESARIEDFSAARAIMERIGETGIRFSIDDFGVASANFDALYQLPFSEIKIDRVFVRDITKTPTARAIVANLLHLAKEVGLTSVAEGIEDRKTFESLREMGCDLAQGFYLARPQSLPQLEESLRLQRDNFTQGSKYG